MDNTNKTQANKKKNSGKVLTGRQKKNQIISCLSPLSKLSVQNRKKYYQKA